MITSPKMLRAELPVQRNSTLYLFGSIMVTLSLAARGRARLARALPAAAAAVAIVVPDYTFSRVSK